MSFSFHGSDALPGMHEYPTCHIGWRWPQPRNYQRNGLTYRIMQVGRERFIEYHQMAGCRDICIDAQPDRAVEIVCKNCEQRALVEAFMSTGA